mmetsp:Transcript_85513/g.151325  ORF Transcript_85513/g.151325 Transcript_85513/m.151325 type:complete len:98 (+) Transcript_85513:1353-1646(+)
MCRVKSCQMAFVPKGQEILQQKVLIADFFLQDMKDACVQESIDDPALWQYATEALFFIGPAVSTRRASFRKGTGAVRVCVSILKLSECEKGDHEIIT